MSTPEGPTTLLSYVKVLELLAAAWDEGHEAGWTDAVRPHVGGVEADTTPNPYKPELAEHRDQDWDDDWGDDDDERAPMVSKQTLRAALDDLP